MAKKKEKSTDQLSEKAVKVLAHLRKQIITGQLKPGDRFPTRLEMCSKFSLAAETIQKIFDTLIADGFATARGMAGTLVADTPPHLCSYGLVFANQAAGQGWTRFETAIFNEATALDNGFDPRFHFYRKISYPSDYQDHSILIEDVRASRVAGLIFVNPPVRNTIDQIQTEAPGIPCVGIMTQPMPSVPAVNLVGMTDKVMSYLFNRGRRRVAFLSNSNFGRLTEQFEQSLLAEMRAHGLSTKPEWMQQVHLDYPAAARNLTRLLFSHPEDRPDAFFISDDNLVEPASIGMLDAKVRVPEDVEVIAHCNFPWPTPSAVLCQRIGYDAREIITTCIDLIHRIRKNENVPSITSVPPRFAEELKRTTLDG